MISARNRENQLQMFTERYLRREGEENMLKLMKYEFRRQLFLIGVMLGSLFVLAAAFFGFYWKGVDYGVIMMLSLMSFATMMVLVVGAVAHEGPFDKDMNTKQGYMLFLLPKKSTTILVAKLLVGLLQTIALYGIFLSVMGVCEQLAVAKFGEVPTFVSELISIIVPMEEGIGEVCSTLFNLFLFWLFVSELLYFIGAIPSPKGKGASAIGMIAFFGTIVLFFWGLVGLEELLIDILEVPNMISTIVELAYLVGADVALFFGTTKLLDKKLSL